MLRQLGLIGSFDQIKAEGVAALSIARPAGDRDQAAPVIHPTIARRSVVQVYSTFGAALSST